MLIEAASLRAATITALAAEPLAGKRVIDWRCGADDLGVWMAAEGAEVYLIDFARETVDASLAAAKAAGLERRVRGIVVQGETLDMFADRGFDLTFLREFPSPPLLGEIARAMKPGARLVLASEGNADKDLLVGWFTSIRLEWPANKGWLARLRPKPQGQVVTARRAGAG